MLTVPKIAKILGDRFQKGIVCTMCADILLYVGSTACNVSTEEDFTNFKSQLTRTCINKSQTIVVTGEHCSGKSMICNRICIDIISDVDMSMFVRNAIHLLNLFGNAKTLTNHDTSKFTSMFKIFMNESVCVGFEVSVIHINLTHLTEPPSTEKNFNVFSQESELKYCMSSSMYKECSALLTCIRYLIDHSSNLECTKVANMLGINQVLFDRTFNHKSIALNNERILCPLNENEKKRRAKRLAQLLYYSLFKTIVRKMQRTVPEMDHKSIAVLDVVGFQNIGINDFEQFMSNYTFEKFNEYYVDRKINNTTNEFMDDRFTLTTSLSYTSTVGELFESQPFGILHITEDMTRMYNCDSSNIIKRLSKNDHPKLVMSNKLNNQFLIKHHVDFVTYNIRNFVNKNVAINMGDIFKLINPESFPSILLLSDIPTVISSTRKNIRAVLKHMDLSICRYIKCIKHDENISRMEKQIQDNYILEACKHCVTYCKQMSIHEYRRKLKKSKLNDTLFVNDFFYGKRSVFMNKKFYNILIERWATMVIYNGFILRKKNAYTLIEQLQSENSKLKEKLSLRTKQLLRLNYLLSV